MGKQRRSSGVRDWCCWAAACGMLVWSPITEDLQLCHSKGLRLLSASSADFLERNLEDASDNIL